MVHGNTGFGVELENGANHDLVIGDVISGQTGNGVVLTGSATSANTVENSKIGTDPYGLSKVDQNGASLANHNAGVVIDAGASANTLVFDVISNDSNDGVEISDSGTTANVVEGSLIGTNATGSAALPNFIGVLIQNGSAKNTIGGTASGARDVISGNSWDGVQIVGSGTAGNVVEGDDIGVSSSGAASLGNGASGVAIFAAATSNVIGGTATGTANVISANAVYGIYISGPAQPEISSRATRSAPTIPASIRCQTTRASMSPAGRPVTPSAAVPQARNLISGNSWTAVELNGSSTSGNLVAGNWIGTDSTGDAPLTNPAQAWPSHKARAPTPSPTT